MAGFISSVTWPNIQLTACSALCRSFNSFISSVVTFFDMDNTSLLLRSLVLIIPTTKILLIISFYRETAWKRYFTKKYLLSVHSCTSYLSAMKMPDVWMWQRFCFTTRTSNENERKCNFMHRTCAGLFSIRRGVLPCFLMCSKAASRVCNFSFSISSWVISSLFEESNLLISLS